VTGGHDAERTGGAPPAWTLYRLSLGTGIVWALVAAEAGFSSVAVRALGIVAGIAFATAGAFLTFGFHDSTDRIVRWLRANGTPYLSTRKGGYWRVTGALWIFLAVVAFRVALFP
jgi:hypothetical protein